MCNNSLLNVPTMQFTEGRSARATRVLRPQYLRVYGGGGKTPRWELTYSCVLETEETGTHKGCTLSGSKRYHEGELPRELPKWQEQEQDTTVLDEGGPSPLTNIPSPELPICSVTKDSIWSNAISLAKTGETMEAMELVASGTPRDFVINNTQIVRCLRTLKTQYKVSFLKLQDFTNIPTWDQSKTLFLWGETGTGKSSLAKLLLPKALFISHLDALKNLNERYNGIIFDDMSFLHLHREAQIHLLDTYDERQIHCRHVCAVIPAGTARIVTSNLSPGRLVEATDPAIKRRMTSWEVILTKKGKRKLVNLDKFY